eukprot:2218456-Rhodomonas_salina.2
MVRLRTAFTPSLKSSAPGASLPSTDTDTATATHRQTQTHRHRHRHTQTQTHTHTHTHTPWHTHPVSRSVCHTSSSSNLLLFHTRLESDADGSKRLQSPLTVRSAGCRVRILLVVVVSIAYMVDIVAAFYITKVTARQPQPDIPRLVHTSPPRLAKPLGTLVCRKNSVLSVRARVRFRVRAQAFGATTQGSVRSFQVIFVWAVAVSTSQSLPSQVPRPHTPPSAS